MLLKDGFADILAQGFRISPIIVGNLFVYSHDTQQFSVVKKNWVRNGYILRWLILLFITLSLIYRAVIKATSFNLNGHSASNLTEINMSLLISNVCFVASERFRVRGIYSQDLTTFLNGVIEIEKKFVSGCMHNDARKIKIVKLFFKSVKVWASNIYPFCLALACAFKPLLPFNLISTLLPNNICWMFENPAFIFVANYFLWFMIAVQGYLLVLEMLTGIMSIGFQQEIGKRKLKQEIRAAEQFQISKDYSLTQGIILQRSVHIILQVFNTFIGSTFVVLLLGLGICQVISAIILINPHTSALTPMPLKIAYTIISFFTFPIIVAVYGFAGKIYDDSEKSLRDLKKTVQLTLIKQNKQRKKWEKFLQSYQVQKIRFGGSNFIDKLTPLVFQQFCINRIIDLVLIRK